MITKEQIATIVEEFAADKDLFVVGIKISPSLVIDVTIDAMNGVSIDTCIALSRFIESRLDRDENDFELTVGTHSISDPFATEQHYIKNTGREVEVLLKSGEKLKGVLVHFAEGTLTLKTEKKEQVEGKKKKQLVEIEQKIALEEVKSTKLIIKI